MTCLPISHRQLRECDLYERLMLLFWRLVVSAWLKDVHAAVITLHKSPSCLYLLNSWQSAPDLCASSERNLVAGEKWSKQRLFLAGQSLIHPPTSSSDTLNERRCINKAQRRDRAEITCVELHIWVIIFLLHVKLKGRKGYLRRRSEQVWGERNDFMLEDESRIRRRMNAGLRSRAAAVHSGAS